MIKNAEKQSLIKTICWTYAALGCIGGAILGFLSLSFLGMTLGLIAGVVTAYILRKGLLFTCSKES